MAEINLLKNSAPIKSNWQVISGLFIKLLAVFAVGVIGYYVFLYLKVNSTQKQIDDTQNSIVQSKSEALKMNGREEFLVRQLQLKEYNNLSGGHLYFSKLLPALAKVTLKDATYSNITVAAQGKITMQVKVPTLQDLDKFLQVFDQPEVNKNFYNVRMSGFNQSQTEQGSNYMFSIQVDFNPGILSYNKSENN